MTIKAKIDGVKLAALKKKLEMLKSPITKEDASEIGKQVITEMKDQISKGISPILGQGRFPAYKNPDKYPGKRKPKRPVNLKLSGNFLYDLTYKEVKSKNGYATEIFYGSKESDLKESGHAEGVNGQPQRPTLPQGVEEFTARIKRLYSKIYRDRINEIAKKK